MPSRRPPRFRYTLRALLVFITLFALWGGYHANRGWKERTAVTVLKRHGAGLSPLGEHHGVDLLVHPDIGYRQLVQFLWGEPCIGSLDIATGLEPEVIEAIERLRHLDDLTLRATGCEPRARDAAAPFPCPQQKVPQAALGRVLTGRRLKRLCLDHWILSDEDIRAVGDQQWLDILDLDSVTFTEEGFAVFVAAPRLRQFFLYNCPLTGTRLAEAQASATLETVVCEKTPIGKEFAKYVARLPHIQGLGAHGQTIDDSFVAALEAHPTLVGVSLKEAEITPGALAFLEQMPALRSLGLPLRMRGRPEISHLRSTRPELHIEF